nr:MAG TPA: hypothetical protein [Caudoviricetes sp.]
MSYRSHRQLSRSFAHQRNQHLGHRASRLLEEMPDRHRDRLRLPDIDPGRLHLHA